jgi:hypothetical protein
VEGLDKVTERKRGKTVGGEDLTERRRGAEGARVGAPRRRSTSMITGGEQRRIARQGGENRGAGEEENGTGSGSGW